MAGSFSTNLGIGALPDSDDSQQFSDLLPLYTGLRALASNLDILTGQVQVNPDDYATTDPFVNIASDILLVTFTEAVSAGHLITFANTGGKLTAKKATSGSANFARAFSLSSKAAGTIGPVRFRGLNPYISGLTPGAPYYLSTTAGLASPTSGYHYVGFALASGLLWFDPSFPAS